MDSWNQEGRFSNNQAGRKFQRTMPHQQQAAQRPPMTSYNANPPQGFYRPTNPQQFYMNPGVHPGHHGYQPNQVYSGRMNPSPQQFMPAVAPSQPIKQLTQAEQNELRKKKNFEEQQRRLSSLKQRGSGHTQKTQMDNALDNLFGNKGSSSNTSSLLGSLGNASKPKDSPVFQGSVTSGQTMTGFSAASTGYRSSSLPVTNTSPSLQNTALTGLYVSAPANTLSGPGNLENSHSFAKVKNVEDDFGDFQQSRADLSFGNIEKPVELTPSSNSTAAAVSASQNPTVTHNTAVGLDSRVSFPDSKSSEEPSVVQDTAAPTPSIEELMKNSLILNKQSQTPVRKFQKLKLPKLVKSQPSHFSESAKASKWNNDLESLSEMFTIPQPAVVQPEPAYDDQSHGIIDSGDDWADFTGTSDQSGAVFQEQANQGLVQGLFDHMPARSEQDAMQGNEVLCGVSSGLSGIQLGQSGVVWKPAVQTWPDVHVGGMMPKMQNLAMAQDMPGGTEHARGSEVVPEQTRGTELENQAVALQDVEQESPDPEKQLYGVRLPEWSKDTTLLPAVYKQIYQICSSDSTDISTSQLYPILLSSELTRDKLGHIWSQCNKIMPGQLNEHELYLILGMIALAQVGLQINKLTLEKLASCITAPIPSFPENIFQSQNDSDTISSVLPPQTNTSFNNEFENKCVERSITGALSGTSVENNLIKIPPHTNIDAVKQPDWSKWKTSKASHIDDKFADFQIIVPKDQSATFQRPDSSTLPNLNFANIPVTSTSNSVDTFGTFQNSGLAVRPPPTGGYESANKPLDNSVHSTVLSASSSTGVGDTNSQSILPEFESISSADTSSTTGNAFGNFASANYSVPETHMNVAENKTAPSTSLHFMSVPLQASQRYALTEEDETIDHHEKAWLKCVTRCCAVIMKSCQILQSVTDPYLFEELFSSPQGISHFSAIIEIYCVSQRVKASVMESAPNNEKLKESFQNIENVWNICLGFQSFKALLPSQSMNFSGCHVNENEDLNLTCGVCLLNVDKSWVTSLVNKGRNGKLSYGSRYYHTTCANFWCNKVDSVLPALQLIVGNSLI